MSDPALAAILAAERTRRADQIGLLAGENHSAPEVRELLGSVFADKYAEGYPGRRHHTGCEQADAVETLAVERAKALFGAEHANVQPLSGTGAVLAAYAALLRPGDAVLAMSLAHGGHLSNGSAANFSGRWFDFSGYGVREDDGLIDLDQVRDLARAVRPKAIVAGSISYPRDVDWPAFRAIADEVGAYLVAAAAQTIGLVAGGAITSPVPCADVVCGVTHKVLGGPRGGLLLCRDELAERVDRAVFPFTQGGPAMNQIAAKALVLGRAAEPEFADYTARTVANARALGEGLAASGLRLLTGGTDTHLVTADARGLGLSGREAERRCEAVGLLIGRCAVPFHEVPPAEACGIRLGTAAVTTRGMGPEQMTELAELLGRVLRPADAKGAKGARGADGAEEVAERVRGLAQRYPVDAAVRESSVN
ncbi:serine hydroxymethyltransferase [Streptacidiphilus carbonis]|uniref:serine hydroxymethyltransferase n=1 Tax=Streptacidiphilus carbonis TaxID=105422 RepID=UPI0005A619E6|nr:serine hydroxymethyltransferase [Streptacidiphilus carbonis]